MYGLGVAAYLDRDRAEEKRAELAARGGLPATIVPFDDGGTTRYRIIVGRYPSNAAAENAALGVMTKLGVSEARPLLLSRGKAR